MQYLEAVDARLSGCDLLLNPSEFRLENLTPTEEQDSYCASFNAKLRLLIGPLRLRPETSVLRLKMESGLDNDQLAEITYDEDVWWRMTYVLNEHQEARPAPRRPAACARGLVGKRKTPRPRCDPACYKCQEYGRYQADCDAVLT